MFARALHLVAAATAEEEAAEDRPAGTSLETKRQHERQRGGPQAPCPTRRRCRRAQLHQLIDGVLIPHQPDRRSELLRKFSYALFAFSLLFIFPPSLSFSLEHGLLCFRKFQARVKIYRRPSCGREKCRGWVLNTYCHANAVTRLWMVGFSPLWQEVGFRETNALDIWKFATKVACFEIKQGLIAIGTDC